MRNLLDNCGVASIMSLSMRRRWSRLSMPARSASKPTVLCSPSAGTQLHMKSWGRRSKSLGPAYDRVLGTVLTRVDLRRLRFYDYYRSSSYTEPYSYLGQPRAEAPP